MVKPDPRRRGLKASPERGAGSRLGRLSERSSPVLRLSSPVSCPSSLVSRPKVGNPMGAEPSWSSGRESRGDRLEIGPLWRVFAFFRRAAKEGRSRRSEISLVLLSSPPQRTNLQSSTDSPFASAFRSVVPSPPAAYFLDVEKVGKDTPKGTASSHG